MAAVSEAAPEVAVIAWAQRLVRAIQEGEKERAAAEMELEPRGQKETRRPLGEIGGLVCSILKALGVERLCNSIRNKRRC